MISLKGDVSKLMHVFSKYLFINNTLPVSQGVGRPKINTPKLLKLQSNLVVMLPYKNALTGFFLLILSAQSSVSLCIYNKS